MRSGITANKAVFNLKYAWFYISGYSKGINKEESYYLVRILANMHLIGFR